MSERKSISPGKYCHIPNCGRKPLKTSCFCGAHEKSDKRINKKKP